MVLHYFYLLLGREFAVQCHCVGQRDYEPIFIVLIQDFRRSASVDELVGHNIFFSKNVDQAYCKSGEEVTGSLSTAEHVK